MIMKTTLTLFTFLALLGSSFAIMGFQGIEEERELGESQLGGKGGKMYPTVKEIDLDAYSGEWFLAKASSKAVNSYLKDLTCVKAQYAPGKKSLFGLFKEVPILKVRNAGLKGAPDGELSSGEGAAWQFFPKYPGAFVLTMKPQDGKPIPPGFYRVLLLGDINDQGKYEWAVVQGGSSLFVLVRNVDKFKNSLEGGLLKILGEKNLAGPSDLKDVYQGENCQYDRLFPTSASMLRRVLELEDEEDFDFEE